MTDQENTNYDKEPENNINLTTHSSKGEKLIDEGYDIRLIKKSLYEKKNCFEKISLMVRRCFYGTKKVLNKRLTIFNNNSTKFSSLSERKKGIIREVIQLKKMDEWDKYFQTIKEKSNDYSIKEILLNLLREDSKYIKLWRRIFSVFVVTVVYVYFFKKICVDFQEILDNLSEDQQSSGISIFSVFTVINVMFAVDCLVSLFQLFTIKHSNFYLALYILIIIPIKVIMSLPFTLCYANFFWISFKFLRLDLINTLFQIVEDNCYKVIEDYIHNSWVKFLMMYLNEIFKFFLVFVLYAHFMTCLISILNRESESLNQVHFNTQEFYVKYLYMTFETFTSVGYGEFTPQSSIQILTVMINMYIGYDLFCLLTLNVKMLVVKLKTYKKENTFKYDFEKFVFQIQKNSGRVLPKNLKHAIYSQNLLKKGLSFPDTFKLYKKLFKFCRSDIKREISLSVLDYLYKQYSIFFQDCSKDFIIKIFSKLIPKIFKPGRVLIDLNKKVDKLYFLFSGDIDVFNKDKERFFELKMSTIFGDWYFQTNTYSQYIYKVSDSNFAVAFVLKKEDYIKISDEHLTSAKEFYIKSFYKIKIYSDMEKIYHAEHYRNSNSSMRNNFTTNFDRINSTFLSASHNPAWQNLINNTKNDTKPHTLSYKYIEDKLNDYKQKIYDFEQSFWHLKIKISEENKEIKEKVLLILEEILKCNSPYKYGSDLKTKINNFFNSN